LLLGGCVSQAKYLELQKKYVERGQRIARNNGSLDEYQEKVGYLTADLRAKEALLKKREEELALVSSIRPKVDTTRIEGMIKDVLGGFQPTEGVSYDSKTGALVLEGSVFFDSGSAKIKSSAKKTLLKVADVLRSRRGEFQITGHTDSDPVVKAHKVFPLGNMQLSGARALNVLLFLEKEGGIPAEKMSFVGCGPHKPRVPNDSKLHKRQNRRVEIMVKEISE
jgi:chemotaxis protein MotB